MVGAGQVMCRLNCHGREQRVHTELRRSETGTITAALTRPRNTARVAAKTSGPTSATQPTEGSSPPAHTWAVTVPVMIAAVARAARAVMTTI